MVFKGPKNDTGKFLNLIKNRVRFFANNVIANDHQIGKHAPTP